MIKVLYDTNIILDIALDRKPFAEYSLKAVNLMDTKINGYINVLTLVNTFYFARKKTGIERARKFIADLRSSTYLMWFTHFYKLQSCS